MEKNELRNLLQAKGKKQEDLFKRARNVRQTEFGDKAFIRAIIEPSNNCGNRCHYCAMNKDNELVKKYRMKASEIVDIADKMAKQGIRTFSLETGEDSEILSEIFKATAIMKKKGYWILGAFGDLEKENYQKLKDIGMDAYLLKFETSDAKNFNKLRPGTTLKQRLKNLEYLEKLGFNIATGNIIGLPNQTLESIVNDILLTKSFKPFTATASPLIPSPGTPLENQEYGNLDLALNTLAIYRILLPKAHIPALCALNFYKDRSQLNALYAGANDVLINTANPESLTYNFAIYSKNKICVSVKKGLEIIKKANLQPCNI